jgi:LCP family protein required for cell wall assembly
MTDSSRQRHPALAAVLSFVIPGLGQAYAGRWRVGLALGVPFVLLIAGGVAAYLLAGTALRNVLFSSLFLIGLFAVNAILFLWRGYAIWDAGRPVVPGVDTDGSPVRHRSPWAIGTVVLLLFVTVAMHGYAAIVIDRLNGTLEEVFSGGSDAGFQGANGGSANGGNDAPDEDAPLNQPEYRWDGTDRVNFLLIGVDSGPGRDEELTDTILVVSVDPLKQEAVMVSVPRDTGGMPLPDTAVYADGRYPGKVNEITTVANQEPELWCPDLPSGADCGIRTLERSVGLYLGITIQYYAIIDLVGFTELIDAVGGVQLCLPGRMIDENYRLPGSMEIGVVLPAGCHAYNGDEALAYARIREGVIELPDGTIEQQSDFKRAERQQEVLLALRHELTAGDLFFELPAFLDAVAATVQTDFPRSSAGDLASLLPLIANTDIERIVLGLPDYVEPPIDPVNNYILTPIRAAIRDEMERLFGPDLEGWYVGSHDDVPPAFSPDQSPSPAS